MQVRNKISIGFLQTKRQGGFLCVCLMLALTGMSSVTLGEPAAAIKEVISKAGGKADNAATKLPSPGFVPSLDKKTLGDDKATKTRPNSQKNKTGQHTQKTSRPQAISNERSDPQR